MIWKFWLGIVSPHQSAAIRALAAMPGQDVTVIAEHGLPDKRRALGWQTPGCEPAKVVVHPTDAELRELVGGVDADDHVHLLGGIGKGTLNRRVLKQLAKSGSVIGLISESADNRGISGLLRRAMYFKDRCFVGRHLDLILAMGQLGVRWFRLSGYKPSRIFPFAYVTERPGVTSEPRREVQDHGSFRIMYLGRIIRLKDGITAIQALKRLADCDWRLDVVGDGPDLSRWKEAAAKSGVAGRIRFCPAVENGAIGGLFREVDLLLLPSRKDGWGAVVNEALMCGVPVVCSDNCGAADLLREPWRGATFKTGSAESLRGVLQGLIQRGRRTEEASARVREWSSALEGPQVAQYLIDVVQCVRNGGPRPSPPWY